MHQNGNRYSSIRLAHSMHFEENYTNVKTLLIALKCDQFNWQVIGDFRMVAFLVGLQGGFSKFPCYLCHWDRRDTTVHYHRRMRPKQSEYSVGYSNIKWDPLIYPIKILLPPLHINLVLIKQFVKALYKNLDAFKHLQNFFIKISAAKIEAGIFVGPQIRKILACNEFLDDLTTERVAWNSFALVVRGFLGNHKAENYGELVAKTVKTCSKRDCRMSSKVHMLDAISDQFMENMGAYSEKLGKRFHQDILDFERRYPGQYNKSMMGDYIWRLIHESDLKVLSEI